MNARMKIVLRRPHQRSAIESRAAAEEAAHVKLPRRAVDVDHAIVVRLLVDEHRLFVVLGWRRKGFPALQNQDAFACPRTCVGERRASRATAHDNYVRIVRHPILCQSR